MKRLLWALAATLAAIMFVGCSRFTDEDAPMVFTNESRANITLFINGSSVQQYGPLGTSRFTVKIDVPRPRYDGYGTGPSQLNRIAAVDVSVLNRDANERSNTQRCYAGAKITTSIRYNNAYSRGGSVSCDTLDAYGRLIPEKELLQLADSREEGGSK